MGSAPGGSWGASPEPAASVRPFPSPGCPGNRRGSAETEMGRRERREEKRSADPPRLNAGGAGQTRRGRASPGPRGGAHGRGVSAQVPRERSAAPPQRRRGGRLLLPRSAGAWMERWMAGWETSRHPICALSSHVFPPCVSFFYFFIFFFPSKSPWEF